MIVKLSDQDAEVVPATSRWGEVALHLHLSLHDVQVSLSDYSRIVRGEENTRTKYVKISTGPVR